MGNKMKDLTGMKFGRLLVTGFSHKGSRRKMYWICKCECGEEIITRSDRLKGGNTKSCGCISVENLKKMSKTHGFSGTDLFWVFENMKSRCYKDVGRHYKNYGGRRITVCEEWLNDKSKFFEWAVSNGYKKGLQIDRKDNDKGYTPENCVFTTRKVNNSHKRVTRHFILYGAYFSSAKGAAKAFDVSVDTIRYWCGIHNKKYASRDSCISFRPYGDTVNG